MAQIKKTRLMYLPGNSSPVSVDYFEDDGLPVQPHQFAGSEVGPGRCRICGEFYQHAAHDLVDPTQLRYEYFEPLSVPPDEVLQETEHPNPFPPGMPVEILVSGEELLADKDTLDKIFEVDEVLKPKRKK